MKIKTIRTPELSYLSMHWKERHLEASADLLCPRALRWAEHVHPSAAVKSPSTSSVQQACNTPQTEPNKAVRTDCTQTTRMHAIPSKHVSLPISYGAKYGACVYGVTVGPG